ncbi:MFS general substrate transporter [Cucurbitaria berberidis CBS 394.84]|uniref:MFS general substrate transporter n=1 Tax=Cucurbitaria berberidis CBS 394.84 TaxID=1168544 RepID=A0A9P4LCD6_9PLEO|nr:MFS general substrate transporter [Cucurbitaria berberidis CBS 394.84]KAF1849262.1 MFS general substrate transporter [Cucurbitaria berberidis CBS 394.84]
MQSKEKVVVAETTAKSSGSSDHGAAELAATPLNYTLKLDLRLIPILGCTYTILFLDRTNIANARIEGFEKSLHMPLNGYNTALWIFYVPFVLVEIPSNMIMSMPRVRPNIFLGCNMLILGVAAMCQGLTASYGGLLALRFLMGIFEATLPAGAALLMAEYYTRAQAALRFAMFFTFGVLGPCISGLLAFGIRNMDGVQGKEGWRWIFILEGILTIAVSFLVFILVPDFPERTKVLTASEKEHLLKTLREDKGDQKLDIKSVNWLKTICDYRILFPTLMFFCCDMTAASMSSFIPTILTELGWKRARAQAMSIPIWITGMVFQIAAAFISGRTGWRFPFILFGILCVLVGWIINIAYSEGRGISAAVRYFSLFCMSAGTFIQMTMTTSWLTNNLRGRPSIAVGTAIILGIGNCANFVASNVFIKKEAPLYPTAFRTGLGITVAGAVFCLVYVGLLWKHNQKLDKKRTEFGGEDDQKEFRYQY